MNKVDGGGNGIGDGKYFGVYDPGRNVQDKEVIWVTFSYRVGVLGFWAPSN